MMSARIASHDNSNKCPSLFEAGTELRVLYVLTNLNPEREVLLLSILYSRGP